MTIYIYFLFFERLNPTMSDGLMRVKLGVMSFHGVHFDACLSVEGGQMKRSCYQLVKKSASSNYPSPEIFNIVRF